METSWDLSKSFRSFGTRDEQNYSSRDRHEDCWRSIAITPTSPRVNSVQPGLSLTLYGLANGEILLTCYGRACFVARSMSRMSEFSRKRSNTIRLPSEVISKVRIAAGLLSRVKRRDRIVLRSSSQKSCPAVVLPSM